VASSFPVRGRFFEYLLAVNRQQLDGFKHWLFHPGMLFQSHQQWWGAKKPRPAPHEGLDLCWFADLGGNRRHLDGAVSVPATFPGLIVKIHRDFLGQSIYVGHDLWDPAGRRLHTVYGHTRPRADLGTGQEVGAGDIIAAISPSPRRLTQVPAHLHLTLAWIPGSLNPAGLTWDNLGVEPTISLLNPLTVFPTPFVVLPAAS